jgi:hypothetical protein
MGGRGTYDSDDRSTPSSTRPNDSKPWERRARACTQRSKLAKPSVGFRNDLFAGSHRGHERKPASRRRRNVAASDPATRRRNWRTPPARFSTAAAAIGMTSLRRPCSAHTGSVKAVSLKQ